jgi:hypothetical protein
MTIKASDLNVIGSFASQSNGIAIIILISHNEGYVLKGKKTRNDLH